MTIKKVTGFIAVLAILFSGIYFIGRGVLGLDRLIARYERGEKIEEPLSSGKIKTETREKIKKAEKTPGDSVLLEGVKDTVTAINDDPFDPEKWMILGKLYERAYDAIKKEKKYNLSSLNGRDEERHYLLKADRVYTKAQKLRPNSANIARLLVQINYRLGEKKDVRRYLKTLMFLHPGVNGFKELGIEETESYLLAAIKGVKKYINTPSGRRRKIYREAAPYYSAAVFLFELNREKEARSYLKRGEEITTSSKKNDYYYRIARFFEKRKEWERCLTYLEKIGKRNPDYRNVERKIKRIKRKQNARKN